MNLNAANLKLTEAKKYITQFLLIAIRPLVLIAIRNGLHYRQFFDVVKQAYIDVAEKELKRTRGSAPQAHVALKTGIDRKDINMIKQSMSEESETADCIAIMNRVDRISKALHLWRNKDPYIDKNGNPREMRKRRGTICLEGLVRIVKGNLPIGTIIDEMLMAKCIERTRRGTYKLVSDTYIPRPIECDSTALIRSAMVIGDLSSTVVGNLYGTSGKKSVLERTAARKIPSTRVAEFSTLRKKLAMNFLRSLDQWLSDAQESAIDSDKLVRVGIGVYAIDEPCSV